MCCTCTKKSLHTSEKTVTIFFAWSFLSSTVCPATVPLGPKGLVVSGHPLTSRGPGPTSSGCPLWSSTFWATWRHLSICLMSGRGHHSAGRSFLEQIFLWWPFKPTKLLSASPQAKVMVSLSYLCADLFPNCFIRMEMLASRVLTSTVYLLCTSHCAKRAIIQFESSQQLCEVIILLISQKWKQTWKAKSHASGRTTRKGWAGMEAQDCLIVPTIGWSFPGSHMIIAVARVTAACAFYTLGGHAGALSVPALDWDISGTHSLHWMWGERAEGCLGPSILLEVFGLWQMCPEGIL